MKLQCQVEIINRLYSALNVRSHGKHVKSTLALGKDPKGDHFIILFTTTNKSGTKYKVKKIIQVFVRCLNEGKATVRFEDPPHDLSIRSEVIQLKCFLKLLKCCITGETVNLPLSSLSNISVIAKDNAPTKLVISRRSDFPDKGFPRTLEALTISGLKLCNFRRDILLLRQLTILDLSDNEIEKIPAEFGRMPNLNELYLANNKLGVNDNTDWRWLFGPQLSKNLKLLDLRGNCIRNLPKCFWKLQKLVTLKLDNNLLDKLPSTIGRISSLRFLTISRNQLTCLPCSLMQCILESIDLSENKFDQVFESPKLEPGFASPWNSYVGSLVNISAKVVLKHNFYYAPNLIPWTLVEFLDNANICICGTPVVSDTICLNKIFDVKEKNFRVVTFDNNRSEVSFECYFCSPRCFSKFNK